MRSSGALAAILFWLFQPFTSHAAPGAARNVLLARGPQESVVAIDPSRPKTILVGSNPYGGSLVDGVLRMPAYVSHDAGRTFHLSTVPPLRPWTTPQDPSVAISSSGTMFYSYLAQAPRNYICKNCVCTGATRSAAVLVGRSADGGRSFQTPTLV